jgi:hydroxymethylglutaryl-CoA lyase
MPRLQCAHPSCYLTCLLTCVRAHSASIAVRMQGLEAALAAGVTEVAIFAAATDSFSQRNINCNVMDSFERFRPVCDAARAAGVKVRGYVSCALGCPYEGYVAPDAVGFVAQSLLEMGCYEISLGDTIGVGTPLTTKAMLTAVRRHVPVHAMAVHFHNTYAMALPNILAALEEGVGTVDSSVAGLGGCPYAKGASGNVPTEDVVYMLHGMGIRTNVDLDGLIDVGQWMCNFLGTANQSKVALARLAQRAVIAEEEAKLADGKAGESAKSGANPIAGFCWPQPPESMITTGKPTVGMAQEVGTDREHKQTLHA